MFVVSRAEIVVCQGKIRSDSDGLFKSIRHFLPAVKIAITKTGRTLLNESFHKKPLCQQRDFFTGHWFFVAVLHKPASDMILYFLACKSRKNGMKMKTACGAGICLKIKK
jgi:hypothetical protein